MASFWLWVTLWGVTLGLATISSLASNWYPEAPALEVASGAGAVFHGIAGTVALVCFVTEALQ